MSAPKDKIIEQIVADFYDTPIMGNVVRPHYVERMIALGLGGDWKLVSADWSGWDLENANGVRIEVKQSAAHQTWTDLPSMKGRATRGSFDIKARTGYWIDSGSKWVEREGRPADIYIFAWHPVEDGSKADHRDPGQWEFYVVGEHELPPHQKSIGLPTVAKRWPSVSYEELRRSVASLVSALPTIKAT